MSIATRANVMPDATERPRRRLTLSALALVVAVAAIWAAVARVVLDHREAIGHIWRYETRYRTPGPMKWLDSIPPNTPLQPRGQAR